MLETKYSLMKNFLLCSICIDLRLTFNKVTWNQTESMSHVVAIASTTALDPLHGVNLEPMGNMHSISSFTKVYKVFHVFGMTWLNIYRYTCKIDL